MTRIDLSQSRWWLTSFACVAFLLAVLGGVLDRPWAAFGFAYALVAFGYLTLLAWLDQAERRPTTPGRGVIPGAPPSSVESNRSPRPGSGGAA